ncbi:AI-2E family transporter [Candidatus Dojkabacteria bacterium]|uniref:AI-2E family transporter n=1 Tax=Candidatus Dojkabacteria bacterium TaxID=2099670 RepID=A0A955KYX5_9BACT|nr:AI-2E family transporter [Candidatus Dojkabacteria bacterium]
MGNSETRIVKIEIEPKILLFAALGVGGILLAWQLRTIVLMLFLAFILNAALRPLVDTLESKRIPRFVSILLIYAIFFVVVGFTFVVIVNEVLVQVNNLLAALPSVFEGVVNFLKENLPFLAERLRLDTLQPGINELVQQLSQSSIFQDLLKGDTLQSVVDRTAAILGASAELLVSTVTVIMVSIYMLQRKHSVYKGLLAMLHERRIEATSRLLEKVEASLGGWLIGQFALMVIVGLMSYLVFWVPSLFDPSFPFAPYALPLALATGILEALPSLGPVIAMIIASLLGLGIPGGGLGMAAYAAITGLLIQNLEAVIVVPQVMKRAVGIDPILTILGVLAGFQLGSVTGALLAVPVIAVVQITIMELVSAQKRREQRNLDAENGVHESQMGFNFVGFVKNKLRVKNEE